MSNTYDVDTFGMMPSAGPWTLQGGPHNERYINDAKGNPIIIEVEFYPWVTANDADLVLMTAAPELLQALELIMPSFQSLAEIAGYNEHYTHIDRVNKAQEAIAKAKGVKL